MMPRTFTFHDIETLTVAQARNRDALYRDYDRVGTNLRGEIAR